VVDVIISEGQNDDEDLARFHYGKQKQDDLIDHFKLHAEAVGEWNREAFGEERTKWRPPLKILIVCDRLLTGFDAPVEQVMYLDKPLRDHNLLQAIARTNRPLPTMEKAHRRGGGLFRRIRQSGQGTQLRREHPRGGADRLGCVKATVPGEVARCMESFKGITIADTRDCLLAALRAIKDPDAAKIFEHNFKSLDGLWEAVSPDACLYEHRYVYNWLCSIYIAYRRRQRGADKKGTFGELSAKTRELIEQNTTFMDMALALPVFKIDKDYVTKLDELPSAADKAAALEAILTAGTGRDDPSFTYRQLGERLARIKAKKDVADKAAEERLKALQEIADDKAKSDEEPDRLGLTQPGEYELFTVLREFATNKDETYLATVLDGWWLTCATTNCCCQAGVNPREGGCELSSRCLLNPGIRPTPTSASIRTMPIRLSCSQRSTNW